MNEQARFIQNMDRYWEAIRAKNSLFFPKLEKKINYIEAIRDALNQLQLVWFSPVFRFCVNSFSYMDSFFSFNLSTKKLGP